MPHVGIFEEHNQLGCKALCQLLSIDKPACLKKNGAEFFVSEHVTLVSDNFKKKSLSHYIELANLVDAAVLVVDERSFEAKWFSDLLRIFKHTKVPIAGLIFNTSLEAGLVNIHMNEIVDAITRYELGSNSIQAVQLNLADYVPFELQALTDVLPAIATRQEKRDKYPLLIVDEAYPSYVLGRIAKKEFHVGQPVVIKGYDKWQYTQIEKLESYDKEMPQAGVGTHVGLQLTGKPTITAGQVITSEDSEFKDLWEFEARISLFTIKSYGRFTPIFDGYTPQLYFKSIKTSGIFSIGKEEKMLRPGEVDQVTLTLEKPVPLVTAQFLLCDEERIIGKGKITKRLA